MNIFFAGSIRGGRERQPEYARIVKALERFGTVSSGYVPDGSLSEYGETSLSSAEIYERERKAIEACDLFVAEVTTPSLGVGYLIAQASALGKRVIALYSGTDALKLSAIIKGDPNVRTELYRSSDDIEGTIAALF
jgi:2'-deoxynucleoside 5'-phosphate N-hydrolase